MPFIGKCKKILKNQWKSFPCILSSDLFLLKKKQIALSVQSLDFAQFKIDFVQIQVSFQVGTSKIV